MANKYHPKTLELVVYIAFKLGNKSNYGATLLGKSLYFVDSMNYVKYGSPISELTYIKQKNGPTPKPNKFLPIRDYLVSIGDLEMSEVNYFGRKQYKFISKREPKISIFSKEELFLIDEVLDSIGDQNASQISELTHLFDAWNIAEEMEDLPFYTFLLNHQEPSAETHEWAAEIIKKDKKKIKTAS